MFVQYLVGLALTERRPRAPPPHGQLPAIQPSADQQEHHAESQRVHAEHTEEDAPVNGKMTIGEPNTEGMVQARALDPLAASKAIGLAI